MNRKSLVVSVAMLVVVIVLAWGGGRWLWKGLLALHGRH
jgi:hypothetical protein